MGDAPPPPERGDRRRPRLRFLAPVAVFFALVVMLGMGIGRDPTLVPSPLVGKALPGFDAEPLGGAPGARHSPADLAGEVWLLNVWASWCTSCLVEHGQIMWLAGQGLAVVGLNHKDADDDALAWLERHGDPFLFSFTDRDGAIGLDLGVYGVPETFLIDGSGTVVHKHIGPVLEADAAEILRKARLAKGGA